MRRFALLLSLILVALPSPGSAQVAADAQQFPPRLPADLTLAYTGAHTRGSADSQAIEHSDAYYTRLTIHRYGSYAILPLSALQYYLGSKLIDGTTDSSIKPAHRTTAYAIAGVFAVNTVTGVWNAVEARHDKEGRGRRLLHGGLMLAADAGFAYTGLMLSDDASDLGEDARRHRNAALVSVGLATTGTLLMWLR
jgi:hypothetical protein